MTPTEHGDLIERLKAATVGGRELDREIERRLTRGEFMGRDHFTTSVDAALAMIERVLPGWIVESVAQHTFADHRAKGPWKSTLRTHPNLPGLEYAQCHHAPTPALALCIATLEALRSQKGEG